MSESIISPIIWSPVREIVVSLSVLRRRQNFAFSYFLRRICNSVLRAAGVSSVLEVLGEDVVQTTSKPRRAREHRHAELSRMWSKRMERSKGRMEGTRGRRRLVSISIMRQQIFCQHDGGVSWMDDDSLQSVDPGIGG